MNQSGSTPTELSRTDGWWTRLSGPGPLSWRGALVAIPVLTIALFWLRFVVPHGADGHYIADRCGQSSQWHLYYRSFLTCYVHQVFWRAANPLLGFDGYQAVALSSAVGGSLALLALWRLCRHPLFLAINICAGSFLVFVGHVETYAWVGACFLWTLVLIREYLLDRVSAGLVMAVFMLGFALHMLMLFYLPVVVLALRRGRPGGRWWVLAPVLLVGAATAILPLVHDSTGGTELGLQRFVPLFEKTHKNHYFTMFSGEHAWILWLFASGADIPVKAPLYLFTILGVPGWEDAFVTIIDENHGLPIDKLGLPVSFLLLAIYARRVEGFYLKLLLLTSAIGVIWTLVWHPDWGPLDWDLFSQYALALHVLVGLLVLPDRSAYVFEPVYEAGADGDGDGDADGA